jgi:hypothetical protein
MTPAARVKRNSIVLRQQHSLFDPSRAPAGKHTAWAYCHVPNGSAVDMTAGIEARIERFAPGFRDLVLARSTHAPGDLERRDANLVGGDIAGGAQDLRQLLGRSVLRLSPYGTPRRGLFICSSVTPPGAGVHGMCGYHAARAALKQDPYASTPRDAGRTPPHRSRPEWQRLARGDLSASALQFFVGSPTVMHDRLVQQVPELLSPCPQGDAERALRLGHAGERLFTMLPSSA